MLLGKDMTYYDCFLDPLCILCCYCMRKFKLCLCQCTPNI